MLWNPERDGLVRKPVDLRKRTSSYTAVFAMETAVDSKSADEMVSIKTAAASVVHHRYQQIFTS